MANVMFLPVNRLSVLLITYNEEPNIYRTLSSLNWISDILIIDSGSTDKTLDIIAEFPNTRVIHRTFDTFANQCNFGLSYIKSEWILSLDADYVLPPALSSEIYQILNLSTHDNRNTAYQIKFRYCINGKPIRSGLLPPRTCLYRRELATYEDQGHGHRVVVPGKVGMLKNRIYHDDRKSILTWLVNQSRYQNSEAKMLSHSLLKELPTQDLIRKFSFLAPFSAFFMCLFLRGGIFDGKEGVIYAFQRVIAESLLYMYMHTKNNSQ
jgi:glycosyltransferase involved in cell wall biosynthesis